MALCQTIRQHQAHQSSGKARTKGDLFGDAKGLPEAGPKTRVSLKHSPSIAGDLGAIGQIKLLQRQLNVETKSAVQ